MTFHVPALPAGVDADVVDDTAELQIARRRKRIEATLTFMATVFVVLAVSAANVGLELFR